MENLHGFHYSAGPSAPLQPSSHQATPSIWKHQQFLPSDSLSAISDAVPSAVAEVQISEAGLEEDEVSNALRDKIASHPLYPKLVNAYIDCQKVGATPEMARLLDEIEQESNFLCERSAWLEADPELDDFMVSFSKNPLFFKFRRPQTLVTYCDLLVKYKLDLSRPFDEATTFLNNMEAQLQSLCNGPSRNYSPGKARGLSTEDLRREERVADEAKRINEDRELKDKLLRRYSGYITGLKHEFSKKKKKEKLPKEATQVLLSWWNIHFKWPYPTEADKVALAEWTGLDQKQVNNWFINQRKRHWKPSEEMQAAAAALDGLYGPFCMSD